MQHLSVSEHCCDVYRLGGAVDLHLKSVLCFKGTSVEPGYNLLYSFKVRHTCDHFGSSEMPTPQVIIM